ncbi:hypothetical protein GDO81_026674 [Engystomops pustulosus]|uniref:Uncharacterized protein n=1 Tax=Engystomops pustulosus TaxID=76066 RepID=A0AAV6YQK3_ENGPU|nr:hypothetical protein GDO81_026674 [Engystomops pustulosus]
MENITTSCVVKSGTASQISVLSPLCTVSLCLSNCWATSIKSMQCSAHLCPHHRPLHSPGHSSWSYLLFGFLCIIASSADHSIHRSCSPQSPAP